EVGRRLQMCLRAQHDARDRDRPEQVLERRLRRVGHTCSTFGPEVLDDDLLDVTVTLCELADREQRFEAFLAGLADPDQDPGGERDSLPPRMLERLESPSRELVRRADVWTAARGQPQIG